MIVQYETPSNGGSISITDGGNVRLLIDPATALLALTISLPSQPQDGDEVTISSSKAVTALTLNGGTIIGGLTAFVIGSFAKYHYNSTASKWFRIG